MRNVPPWIWLLAAAVYFICPLDGDYIPVLGWIDDWVVAYLGIKKWRSEKKLAKPQTNSSAST